MPKAVRTTEQAVRSGTVRTRKAAEQALLSGTEGRFEATADIWLKVEMKETPGHSSRLGKMLTLTARAGGSQEAMSGFTDSGRFPTSPGVAGEGFPRVLDRWEEKASAEALDIIESAMSIMRQSGMGKSDLARVWDESLVREVIES